MTAPRHDAALLEESAEELYEDAPCGYLSTSPDGVLLKVNATFERWTGYRREDLLGQRRFQDLLSAGGRIYHETHYRPLLQMQDAVSEIALDIECADGRRLPVLVNSVLRRDEAGRPALVRTTVLDATARRSYERELVRARQEAEELQRRSGLLADLSRVLVLHTDPARRGEALIGLLTAELADGALVRLADSDAPLAASGEVAEADALSAAALSARAVQERRDADGCLAAAGLPMVAGNRLVGALGVLVRPEADSRGDQAALLEEVADRAAVALDNALLFQRERTVAVTLQRAALEGDIPLDPRYAIGTHYNPAVETLEVGGDWYDAFKPEPDRVTVVLGDVVGKGIVAAATMGRLRSALRALALSGLGPGAVLEQLERFVEHGEQASGATVAIVDVDLVAGTLRMACAGHPPPVLLPPDGPAELMWEGRSTPLGAIGPAGSHAEATLALAPGSRLLLYSDGIVERRDRPIDAGIDLLVRAFDRRRAEPVSTVGQSLDAELLTERHGADDVCTLVLELTPAG